MVAMQDARDYNLYKTGFAGGSESHNTAVFPPLPVRLWGLSVPKRLC